MGKQVTDVRQYIEKYITRLPESGCWIWMGGSFNNGYGQTRLIGFPHSAHRLAWHAYRGPLSRADNVLHRCDIPSCCNPYHLFLGTQKENLHDMIAKKRHIHRDGSRRNSKLTTEQAMAIFSDSRTQDAIAADYGVSQSLVSLIKLKKSWLHLFAA